MEMKPNPNAPLVILYLFSLLIPALAWTNTCVLTFSGTALIPGCSPSSTCSMSTTYDVVFRPSPICTKVPETCTLTTGTVLITGRTTTTVGCTPSSTCVVTTVTSGGTTTFPTCKSFSSNPTPVPTPTPTPTPTYFPPVPMWGQCGGIGWTGGKVCVQGAKCVVVIDQYYSE